MKGSLLMQNAIAHPRAGAARLPGHRRLVHFHGLADERAVEIVSVEPDGLAGQAGLREGDLVVAINEQPVRNVDDLHRFLAEWPIQRSATLTMVRGQERSGQLRWIDL